MSHIKLSLLHIYLRFVFFLFGVPVPIISSTEEDITVNAEDFDHFVPQFSLSTNNDFMLISEDITLGPKQQPMLSQSLKVSFFF